MKLFLCATVVALALTSPAVASSSDGRRIARGETTPARREDDRILQKKKKGKGKAPINCCDVIKKLLELDQACKAVVVATEESIVCEQPFAGVGGKGKGAIFATPEVLLDAAFRAYDSFLVSFQAGLLGVTPATCFPAGATPIPLATFGDWCVSATIAAGVITYAPPGPLADVGAYIAAY